jgi:glycosyltransferase involved in cell wall biosynthesis
MKILVLTSTYSRWENDTEPKFVDNLCHYLSQENEVHVIAPHAPGIPREERMNGIQVFRFKYCFEKWQTLAYDGGILPSLKQSRMRALLIPFFLLSQSCLMLKLMRQHRYDIVHAHWMIPQGLVAALTCTFSRRSVLVITSHGGDMFSLKGKFLTWLKKWATSRADQLTVVSSTMKAKAVGLQLKDDSSISVIPMGINSHTMFYPPPPDTRRHGLLFVGRLVEKKGIEHLIGAMPLVLKAHPDQLLTIVGHGPLFETLQQLCEKIGVKEHVEFTGAITNKDIPRYLQRSAITVFPSIVTDSGDQEGTPVAVMEALACECAAIVSDYPGARDIIVEGENGLLVAQKAPDQIAAAINYLLDHPEARRKMGEAGRRTVQRDYDWSVICAKFLSLFHSLKTSA